MLDKVRIKIRGNTFYPYSIVYMGREEVLLKKSELIDLYNQIGEILAEDEEM